MQRWMQAKEQLARKHGRTISGAGRAMGSVFEDRPLRDGIDRTPKPRTPKVARMPCMKADKPKPWRYMGGDPYTC